MRFFAVCACMVLLCGVAFGADGEGSAEFLQFVKNYTKAMQPTHQRRENDLGAWQRDQSILRENLLKSWHDLPRSGKFGPVAKPPTTEKSVKAARDLVQWELQTHGEQVRDGYRVEKLSFQTLPGVRMMANAYVPAGAGPFPAVLCVHGHWKGAKQDPVVQSRCIGLAKLGFLVLAVDAFGAGERGIDTALGEYHGATTAALLYPIGEPLSGIQVYENLRAIDYLCTRSDVNPAALGVTGASGGGNQSMYAGAWDTRLKSIVPVCSVGNYQAFLGAACCQCEVLPGALQYTEESGLFSLAAGRGVMVVSATRDSPQFAVEQAKKTLAGARPIFEYFNKTDDLKHTIIDSGHDYNQPMREAMYGWMTKHLKQTGNGEPIAEPKLKTEDPEALRCYPGDTRPAEFTTIPKYAANKALACLERFPSEPINELPAEWITTERERIGQRLYPEWTHDRPKETRFRKRPPAVWDDQRHCRIAVEVGLSVDLYLDRAEANHAAVALVPTVDGFAKANVSTAVKQLRAQGYRVAILELRATGRTAVANDQIRSAADHNSAEWSLWIGRPLLGQWLEDLHAAVGQLRAKLADERNEALTLDLVCEGPSTMVGVVAGAQLERFRNIVCVGGLTSFVSDVPYVGQRMAIMVPGLLQSCGDVRHMVAATTATTFTIVGGVDGGGKSLSLQELRSIYRVPETLNPGRIRLEPDLETALKRLAK